MTVNDPQYWTTLTNTEALISRLQAFLDNRETRESLQFWAQTLMAEDSSATRGNAWATDVLINLWNASAREPPSDESCSYILRRIDVHAYLCRLQRGEQVAPTRDLGYLSASPADVAARLGRETERHILDGIGWCEYLQLASPGSGRVFILECSLDKKEAKGSWVYADRAVDTLDATRDFFETLAIDLADIKDFAQGFVFDVSSLPCLTLCCQDGTGVRTEVSSFTGRRKADATLRRYEAQFRDKMYWIEDRAMSDL